MQHPNKTQVASYSYDAWGNVTSQSGTLAEINPIRYKGYYYDSDTGMYYLQSRYYDPSLRRFINADDPNLIEDLAKSSVLGTNLFSYCENNGVIGYDPTGEWDKKIHRELVTKIDSGLSSSEKNAIAKYDEECDKTFKSQNDKHGNYISYPFHSRTAPTLSKAITHLYYYALQLKNAKSKKRFTYGEFFKYYFTAYDRSKGRNERSTACAEEANKKILNYVNGAKNAKEQSYILMGFCMHMIQDFYAHQVIVYLYKYNRNNKVFVGRYAMTNINKLVGEEVSGCEDETSVLPWRYEYTKKTTKEFLSRYKNKKRISKVVVKSNGHKTESFCQSKRFKNGNYYLSSFYQEIIFY